MCHGNCPCAPAKCHNRRSNSSVVRCERRRKRQQETRGREAPSSGWPSAPRAPSIRSTFESSPARGGETEPPPPRGSRRLRARARHFAAQGKKAVFGSGARAEPCPRARHRARSAAARGEHLGPAPARGKNRDLGPWHAAPGSAARKTGPATPVNAATQGLVRFPVWRARVVLAALMLAFALLAARSLYLQALKTG